MRCRYLQSLQLQHDKPWLLLRKWPLPPPVPLLAPLAAEVVSEQKGGGGESEWSVIPLHWVSLRPG